MSNPPARPSLRNYVLMCIALGLIGGALLPFTFTIASNMVGSYFWDTVPATVESHAIECRSRRRNIFDCHLRVRFRYAVEGKPFASDRVNVWSGVHKAVFESEARANAEAYYPIGSVKKAYVHPRDPSYAVLEPGISDPLFFLLLCILILLPVGAVLGLVFGTRSKVFKRSR